MKKLSAIFAFVLLSLSFGQIQKVDVISDGIQLDAYFYEAEGKGLKPTLIWMHGLPGKKETGTLVLAQELNKKDINVLAFDYRGLWNDQGVFTMANSQMDLKSVIDFVHEPENAQKFSIDTNRIIVAGHSYGSAMATIAGVHDERVKEIVLLGLADLSYVVRNSYKSTDIDNRALVQLFNSQLWGEGKLLKNFNDFMLDLTFNNYKYDFVENAKGLLDNRLFIIVSRNDLTVPIENHFFPLFRKLQQMEHSDIEVLITGHDHNFGEFRKNELSNLLSDWIKK